MSSTVIHPTDQDLEEFHFGRLPPTGVDQVEEHLLWCHGCQDRYVALEAFVRDVRANIQSASSPAPARGVRWPFLPAPSFPKPALAGAALVLCAVGLSFSFRDRPGTASVEETLASDRGSGPGGGIQVHRARRMLLHLDTTGLTLPADLRVELVSASGQSIQQQASHEPSLELNRWLPAGQYLVRLNAASGDPLREYVLDVVP